jgi:very-long-chain enoyl-CoA reductase
LSSQTDVKLVPKKPIKKLPTSVEITDKTTVQDVKDDLAKRAGGWDPNRFGLYEPEKKKLLKDRKALISQQESVLGGKEILVKDLGMSPNLPYEPLSTK